MTSVKLTGDQCMCAACNLRFNSTAAFDKHRVGPYSDRRCLTEGEMLSKSMAVNDRGLWVTRIMPMEAITMTRISGDRLKVIPRQRVEEIAAINGLPKCR